jgi:hypothetical protein
MRLRTPLIRWSQLPKCCCIGASHKLKGNESRAVR